jgi:hypothetical protein
VTLSILPNKHDADWLEDQASRLLHYFISGLIELFSVE